MSWLARRKAAKNVRPAEPGEVESAFNELPKDGPTWTALFFWYAVQEDPVVEPMLRRFCTPEFLAELDVGDIRARLAGGAVTNIPRYPAPDMANVLFVVGEQETKVVRANSRVQMMAQVVTLLFRPDLGGWRVHSVGNLVDPEQVPV